MTTVRRAASRQGTPQEQLPLPNAELIKYLPVLFKYASEAPAFVVGFVVTMIYVLAVDGVEVFSVLVAPTVAFRCISIVLSATLIRCVLQAIADCRTEVQHKVASRTLAQDLRILQHEPALD